MIDQAQAERFLTAGTVIDADGDKVGRVGQVYTDNETGQASWVTVKTGFFGANEAFVPLSSASVDGDVIKVPFDKPMIKDAPHFDADAPLDETQEAELYRYYGLTAGAGYTETTTTTAQRGAVDRGVGHDTSGPNSDEAMTRSEEHLRVGTEKVEAGRARLRKIVVTEQQNVVVPVSHDEVRVVREPITEANRAKAMDGPVITEAEHEVVLMEDRVVVDKEVVPVERIRVGTETVTDNRQVTGTVRKEQIELDSDVTAADVDDTNHANK